MSRPVILVSTRHEVRKGKGIQFVGELHLSLLAAAGALPVPLLINRRMIAHLPELLESADGVLITEGGDLGPELRGPTGTAELDELDPVKDEIEAVLMRAALSEGLPVLGICRGAELMNVLLGGSLYSDLPSELGAEVVHLDPDNYHRHRHPIRLVPESPLAEIYEADQLSVTSYHHQGVRELADPLTPLASSPDGLVEAFMLEEHPFAWGLQFHPERQQAEHPAHAIVHRELVAAARRHADARDSALREGRMRPPRILIPTRRDTRKTLPIQFVHEAHAEAVLASGGIPVPVPSLETLVPAIDDVLALGDGLLLVEGGDVAPDHSPTPNPLLETLKELDPARDRLEMALARRALEESIPTLGTCRGAQVINLVAGGSLYSHIPTELGTSVTHVDGERYDDLRHPITIVPDTPLSRIYNGDSEIQVTSVHHQGVSELALGMTVAATSTDGLIEAFHSDDHPFLLAVQHHPERQFEEHHGHIGLYRALVEAARAHMA